MDTPNLSAADISAIVSRHIACLTTAANTLKDKSDPAEFDVLEQTVDTLTAIDESCKASHASDPTLSEKYAIRAFTDLHYVHFQLLPTSISMSTDETARNILEAVTIVEILQTYKHAIHAKTLAAIVAFDNARDRIKHHIAAHATDGMSWAYVFRLIAKIQSCVQSITTHVY